MGLQRVEFVVLPVLDVAFLDRGRNTLRSCRCTEHGGCGGDRTQHRSLGRGDLAGRGVVVLSIAEPPCERPE